MEKVLRQPFKRNLYLAVAPPGILQTGAGTLIANRCGNSPRIQILLLGVSSVPEQLDIDPKHRPENINAIVRNLRLG